MTIRPAQFFGKQTNKTHVHEFPHYDRRGEIMKNNEFMSMVTLRNKGEKENNNSTEPVCIILFPGSYKANRKCNITVK